MGAAVAILVGLAWLALMWMLWLRPIADASRRPRAAFHAVGRSRAGVLWLIVLAGWVGGAYYVLRIRPDLVAVAEGVATDTAAAVAPARSSGPAGPQSPGGAPTRLDQLADRELLIRNIPPEMTSTSTIPPGSAFRPLPFGRQHLIDAVLEIDSTADTSQPHRVTVALPGLKAAIAFPLEDPLSQVMLRVDRTSDRHLADQFVGQLLARLDVRAFDLASPTLIFSPQQ